VTSGVKMQLVDTEAKEEAAKEEAAKEGAGRRMGALRRFLDRLSESDGARLESETRGWAEKVPGTVRIGQAPLRDAVKIAGVIQRITVSPVRDQESVEALVSDGTGEVVVVFMGRRGVGGLTLGTRVVVEGVIGEQHGVVRMINPRLEFTA
jgi:hypothetical protein